MPTAEIISTTSRRNALRLGVAATVSSLAAPVIAIAIASPTDADAELIRLCGRLVVNRARTGAAFEAITDEDERAEIMDPLNEEWFELSEALSELERPRTLEGARAMALAAMAEIPRDLEGNIEYGELHVLLSMGCVDFILAAVPG
jgi:hypothetical protein